MLARRGIAKPVKSVNSNEAVEDPIVKAVGAAEGQNQVAEGAAARRSQLHVRYYQQLHLIAGYTCSIE
jgi:hypothetical protein